ncbi:MAG: family 10 glycosylhydrolase [Candidatus Hydrogenedentes bacterium]|nr:family 10 glycosylhydrolase [Candidatus Hydrogenedentota bacterium]
MADRLNRRAFLSALGVGPAAALVWHGAAGGAPATLSEDELIAARKRARQRKRRIIMNNDGNDANAPGPGEALSREQFLSRRTAPLVGSQVDAIFYCTGVFNSYTHRSEESEQRKNALTESGGDSLEIMTEFGHANGMEVFWSMRMNDTHDSSPDRVLCQWKQDHPECLVGTQGQKFPYGCGRWSSVDYGMEVVRDKVFRILEDVCSRYDVDGIEMDFFRHPVLFRPQMTGDPVTEEHCALMTGLVRRVRAMTERIGRERGRPLLIAVRVPDSVGYCKAMGIDLVGWLEEDLIDMVTGAGYFKLEPWENLAALGRKYDVPAYACLVSRRIMDGGQPEAATALQVWRGEALNAWKAGVSGIYTFNRFDPEDPIFRELGDPALLATLEHVDQTAYVANMWSRPEKWLKGGLEYLREPSE